MHFLEVMAARIGTYRGSVRRILERKLTQALVSFKERFAKEQSDAKANIRRVACVQPTPLGELVRYIEQHSPPDMDGSFHGSVGIRTELKTTRYFRNTWSKLSVDKQVTQALEQAPKNAGPINAHMLVLRSLAQMRDISPDYLNRFTSYVDTLLCLDQGLTEKPSSAKNAFNGQSGKKTKGRSSRPR
jgi:hypothetical protein